MCILPKAGVVAEKVSLSMLRLLSFCAATSLFGFVLLYASSAQETRKLLRDFIGLPSQQASLTLSRPDRASERHGGGTIEKGRIVQSQTSDNSPVSYVIINPSAPPSLTELNEAQDARSD